MPELEASETIRTSGDREAAEGALRVAEPEIRRGVSKGVLKLNTASRRISRLARKVNLLAAGGGSETGAGERART